MQRENLVGKLSIIAMKGCEAFTEEVNRHLKEDFDRAEDLPEGKDTFLVRADCPRFGSGEAKGIIRESLRGHDVFIICDPFNHGVHYEMFGQKIPMSPDEHFADLKRVIGAIGGKARRITVIMPMLYEGRQHRRSARESLDCAMMLQELTSLGVFNIITFDAHDARVQNAIPLHGFESVQPTYQMIKALIRNVPNLVLNADHVTIVSPDEGGMSRCIYFSSVLKLDLGMFYKRRNYAVVVNGRNPIEAHEYLGKPVSGKDVVIVDDMISSGDSLLEVAKHLKERGATRIFAFTTFGLFCDGLSKFDEAYADGIIDRVFTTNLIYRMPELRSREWYCEVDLTKYVASLINTLNHDESLADLLDPVKKIHTFVEEEVRQGRLKV